MEHEEKRTIEIDGVLLHLEPGEEIESLDEFDGNFKKEKKEKGD